MKRLWFASRDSRGSTWVRRTIRRVPPVLTSAVMAGALWFPSQTLSGTDVPQVDVPPGPVPIPYPTVFRTGGAVIEAWAIGTLSEASQPDSHGECDLGHVCELVISSSGGAGTGTGATIKNSSETPQAVLPTNLAFSLAETIDYSHPINPPARGHNGQGACYSASGSMSIELAPSSALVLDIVGQACQLFPSAAQLVFTGSYITDSASSGEAANVDGIGAVNINNPSGLPGTGSNLKASLLGQLEF